MCKRNLKSCISRGCIPPPCIDRMRICGIIAEYDPFHNGHAWHLAEAKRVSQADLIVCAMSMSFTQRGMPALLPYHLRAEMALRNGADIVLGLPVSFSVCDAERFALGGVHILKQIGAHALSFGVEPSGLAHIHRIAAVLEDERPDFQMLLHQHLATGKSFPQAQGLALAGVLGLPPALLNHPNLALAICYARANMRLMAGMDLYPIPRNGNYHDSSLPEAGFLPSAAAVRKAVLANDWKAVERTVPPDAYGLLRGAFDRGEYHPTEALTPLLRWHLRQCDGVSSLPGLSEGIENRLQSAADCMTREEMVLRIKSKRYPFARISRMLTHLLLGTDFRQLEPLPLHAYVLGFRRGCSGLLRSGKKNGLRLINGLHATPDSPEMLLDAHADDLWALGAHQPYGAIFREKPVIL